MSSVVTKRPGWRFSLRLAVAVAGFFALVVGAIYFGSGALLERAPQEVILAFRALSNQDKRWTRKIGQRENLNMRLRRLTGFDRMRLDVHRNYNFREALDGLFA